LLSRCSAEGAAEGTVEDKENEVFALSASFVADGLSSVLGVVVDPPNEKPEEEEAAGGFVSAAGFAPKANPDFSSGLVPAAAPPKPTPPPEEEAVPLLSPEEAPNPKPVEAGAEPPVFVEKEKPAEAGLLSLESFASLGAEESENPPTVEAVAEGAVVPPKEKLGLSSGLGAAGAPKERAEEENAGLSSGLAELPRAKLLPNVDDGLSSDLG
jgi:hypothetical protein